MIVLTVIINDYRIDRKSVISYSDSDMKFVESVWNSSDQLLVDLQSVPVFKGREYWCDLEPTHWRVMIVRNLTQFADLSVDQLTDTSNKTAKSLHFLISGLIYCLEVRSECKIEIMHINRIGDNEVAFDFVANLNMAIDFPGGKPKNGLRVVVDNEE